MKVNSLAPHKNAKELLARAPMSYWRERQRAIGESAKELAIGESAKDELLARLRESAKEIAIGESAKDELLARAPKR